MEHYIHIQELSMEVYNPQVQLDLDKEIENQEYINLFLLIIINFKRKILV
jgi:hypothetical protein